MLFFSGSVVIEGVQIMEEHNESDSFLPNIHIKLKQTKKKISCICILNNVGVSLGSDLK